MLKEIWRYPLKSCSGGLVPEAEVRVEGLVGDRAWAVVDTKTGFVASAKHPRRWGSLLTASASIIGDALTVRLPDGQLATSTDPEALDRLLSSFVDRPISVRRAGAIEEATIERTDPRVDALLERSVLELGDVVTGRLGSASAPGTVFDFAPIHLISTATLEALEAGDATAGDPRRFRPNLVIDVDGPAFQENEWPGRQIALGSELILDVLIPSPRCVVPSLAQPGLPRSVETVRSVARLNRIELEGHGMFSCVGAYATVRQPGSISVGDPALMATD